MQVSQVAYDRFVLELPAADATWRPLADPECLAETAAWLWDFGPKPLIAVIGVDKAAPSWLTAYTPRGVRFAPGGASARLARMTATPADAPPGAKRTPRGVRFAPGGASAGVAVILAKRADAPPGAKRTPRGVYAVSQLGAALSTPITAMSGFGPKSQSHAAVSARHSGSARGRHVASAAGSSSTKRSYATWLTCMFWLWNSSRPSQRGVPSPGERGLVLRYYLQGADQAARRRRG